MSTNFESIDLTALTTVTGGYEVTASGKFRVKADGTGLEGEIDGSYSQKQSGYETCLAKVTSKPDWTPEGLRATCGPPQ